MKHAVISPNPRDHRRSAKSIVAASLLLAILLTGKANAALDAAAIGKAVGVQAQTTDDGVVRVAMSRTDLQVKVDGYALNPFAGLGSWAAFMETPHGTMVMGDTVVFEDEVTAAMDAALGNGLEVTAIHNHFAFDHPKVYFMHIGGMGDAPKLAAGVRAVWDAIHKVRVVAPVPQVAFEGGVPEQGTVSAGPLEEILGAKAATNTGVAKFTWGREATMMGHKIGGSMGLTTWAAFSGSDKLAVVDGDFIMTSAEVQTVLKALRAAGYHVVALHNHMLAGDPAYFFTHFWGKGAPADLARGLKSVLDAQKAVKP